MNESGYIDGRNLAIEYRLAEGHNDRLPSLVADLVDHKVAVIITPGIDPAKAAKAATTTIPTVFIADVDPVNAGLVASLNRPGDGGGVMISVADTGTGIGSQDVGRIFNPLFTTAAQLNELHSIFAPFQLIEPQSVSRRLSRICTDIELVRISQRGMSSRITKG